MASGICGICKSYVTVLDVYGACAGCRPPPPATVTERDAILEATREEQRIERTMRAYTASAVIFALAALGYLMQLIAAVAAKAAWWTTALHLFNVVVFAVVTGHYIALRQLVRARKI